MVAKLLRTLTLAVLLFTCCIVVADIVHLNTGGRIEGKIIERDLDKLLVKTPYGMTTIPHDEIESIEEKPTVWEIYTEKSTKIDSFDIEGHWKIAQWCKDKRGLEQEYKTELELVLSLKPGHKEATAAYAKLREEEEKRLAKFARREAERKKKAARKSTPKTATDSTKPPKEGEAKIPEITPGERQEITLDPARKKKIYDLIDKFFDESPENVDARQKILDEIDKLGPIPKKVVKDFKKAIFKKCKKELFGFEKVGARYKLKHKLYPGTFILGLPRGRGKKYGLLVGLHGGGEGVGDASNVAPAFGGAAGRGCITCFPTVIKKEATAWNKEREEKFVIQLIQELKRAYPAIDTNRIYICGHSMGGYGTWAIGTHYADMFAAINPCAGGIFVMRGGGGVTLARGTVVNLKATPIYFYHGADDRTVGPESDRKAAEVLKELKEKHGPYEYVYKEYNGIGHGWPPGGMGPIIDWMLKHKRDPYPDYIVWEPSRPYKKLFWWIKVRSAGGQIIAKYKKSKNLIEIEASLSAGISIFLNEKMVNLTKPVKVMVNGKEVFNDYVYFSASALLESIQDKKDPNQYFTAKIDL